MPVKANKIFYISYFGDEPRGDIRFISEKLKQKGEYQQVFLLKKIENTLWGKFSYFLSLILQVYHFHTSRLVVITGNNYVVSTCPKKPKTKVIQLWHAVGAIKKFGYDFSRKFEIANYDYVIVASPEVVPIYASAFRLPAAQILPLGVAKTDWLFSPEKLAKDRILLEQLYPVIKGRKVILYAPTFRGENVFNIDYVDVDLERLSKALGDQYVILYKLHPLHTAKNLGTGENIINVSSRDLYEVFAVADILISDYSSLIFDFSILEKPMVFFVPDLKQYEQERGLYYNFMEFAPGPVCFTEDEVVKAIKEEKFNLDKVLEIKKRFFAYHDGRSTERIVAFLLTLLNDEVMVEVD